MGRKVFVSYKYKDNDVKELPKVIEHYQSLGYTFKGIDDTTFTPHQRVLN